MRHSEAGLLPEQSWAVQAPLDNSLGRTQQAADKWLTWRNMAQKLASRMTMSSVKP